MTDNRMDTTSAMQMETKSAMMDVGKYWWVLLLVGIAWLIVGYFIFQFDITSVRAVGIAVGVMFLVAGLQYIVVGAAARGWNWLWYVFGALLIIAGLIAMFNPEETFLAIASILGFIFVMLGVMWVMEALLTKARYDLWWLTLISGFIMIGLGFWIGNQFFFAKAETLLVFAGVWALMKGITDIIAAFQVKKTGKVAAEWAEKIA